MTAMLALLAFQLPALLARSALTAFFFLELGVESVHSPPFITVLL
jgi:hypothetical protein